MKKSVTVLLLLMTLVMLAGFSVAVPAGSLSMETQQEYMNEGPADVDDEYAFLFD